MCKLCRYKDEHPNEECIFCGAIERQRDGRRKPAWSESWKFGSSCAKVPYACDRHVPWLRIAYEMWPGHGRKQFHKSKEEMIGVIRLRLAVKLANKAIYQQLNGRNKWSAA